MKEDTDDVIEVVKLNRVIHDRKKGSKDSR